MIADIAAAVLIWAGLCIVALVLWHQFVSYHKNRPVGRLCALCRRRPVERGTYICGPCCANLLDGPGPDPRVWR